MNRTNARFCFLDIDINNHRKKLATAAAFVDSTDSRYGFSCKQILQLGGSELKRIPELITTDHEWSFKNTECNGIEIRPPTCGNRIIIELDWESSPLACENFATLCANGSPTLPLLHHHHNSNSLSSKIKPPPIGTSGKPLTYRQSKIHRIIPNFIIQGGDFVFGNGSGGESIYNGGKKFKDDKIGLLQCKHDQAGLLSMGNSGKNANSSQFFFTLSDTNCTNLNGKHVVFGKVLSGMSILRQIEQYGNVGNGNEEPAVPVQICDCGIYQPLTTIVPAAGYWLDQPDSESFNGISPTFIVRPRIILVGPTQAVIDKFQQVIGNCASISKCIILNENNNNDEIVVEQINNLLGTFIADVVLVASACKSIVDKITELPSNWAGSGDITPSLDEVIIPAKPLNAMTVLHTKSWLASKSSWQLDGAQ